MNDLIVALCLITAEPTRLADTPSPEDFTTLGPQLRQVAIDMEILDPREVTYYFTDRTCWASDVDSLRLRYRELLDAPRLADAERLPCKWVLNAAILRNREYRCELVGRRALELDRAEVLDAAIAEVDALYRIYDSARDARCGAYYTSVRRRALLRLRESLGEEAWARGELPPNVPTYRFSEQ